MTSVVVRKVGPSGDEKLIAPRGCEGFDKTAVEAWYWLCVETQRKDHRLQRDKFMSEAKIEVLAQVLANAHGMAGTYWILAAREIVKTGWRVRC